MLLMVLNGDGHERWKLTREKILMGFGICLLSFEAVISAIGAPFRFEIVLAGLACMGISIAQWGDKKEKQ
jgi:hypothetical protein